MNELLSTLKAMIEADLLALPLLYVAWQQGLVKIVSLPQPEDL